jgi:hypothetical protein
VTDENTLLSLTIKMSNNNTNVKTGDELSDEIKLYEYDVNDK